jgi:DNA mismatch repair protein MLH3
MLTKAGLVPLDTYSLWIPASAMSSSVHVRGVICLRPAPTKQVQFLSIGIHPVRAGERCSNLLEHINGVFNSSDFGTIEDNVGLDEAEVERRWKDKRFKSDGQTLKNLRTGTKGIDRWPMFNLNIRLREDAHAIAYEKLEAGTSTAFQSAVEVLDALIRSWLTTNNFSIKGQRHKRSHVKEIDQVDVRWRISAPVRTPLTRWKDHPQQQEDSLVSTGTYKRTPSVDARIFGIASPPNTPFHDFSRIKYGTKPAIDGIEPNLEVEPMFTMTPLRPGELNRVTQQPPNAIAAPVVDMTGGDASEEFRTMNDNDPSAAPEDDTFEWEDPISKEKYQVNSRTGQAVLSIQQPPRSSTAPLMVSSRDSQFHKPITLSRTRSTPTSTSRLDSFLQGWQNPIFKTAEHGIRQVGFDFSTTDDVSGIFNHRKQIEKAFSEMPSSHASKLCKSSLKKSVVISQVDKKFILLVMPGDSNASPDRVLTLVDQHATDERVQVEKLFAELLMPNDTHSLLVSALGLQSRIKYTLLTPPLVFEISKLEMDLFCKHAAHFADWGILYDLSAQDSDSKGKLVIRTLPPLIAERCRLEPTTLISLLRAEVWTLADSATPTTAHPPLREGAAPGDEQNWVKRMGGCPQGLINIINSRACRSAIMFNDELSREECEELVKKVSECVFPFQCAHGRPSMVPLVGLGTVDGLGALEDTALPEHDRRSFVQAYRDWHLE